VTGATVNSTGAMNASGTITGATVNSNGNITAASGVYGGYISSTGNINAAGAHTGGSVSVTGDVNANGRVRGVGGIMSPSGIFYVVDNLNYYVGRGSDGAWRFVENGNPTFTIDSSGNATAAGSLYGGTVTSAGDTHVGNSIVIQHDVIFANATNPGRSSLFGTGDLGSLILNKSGGGEEAIRGYQSIGETQIIANGVIGLRITNNGDGYFIGNVYGAGFNPSDTRIKEQSEPYTRGLADVLRLMPKTYKLMRDPDGPWHVSVDAQALLQTIPEAVAERDCTQQDGLSDQLFIQPDFVHYAALNAIKELSEMVDTLTARVAALEEAGVIAERRWRVGA
jgi:hypothetical protein